MTKRTEKIIDLTGYNKVHSIYAGDFETTVYEGQEHTEVWSSALALIETDSEFQSDEDEEAVVLHSIDETVKYFENSKENATIYYHNLKFDGMFWLDYLLKNGYKFKRVKKSKKSRLHPGEYYVLISSMGEWYQMFINTGKTYIEIRDSLKLIPLSLKVCGKSFGTEHQKLTMEYTGKRFSGCEITPEEMEYIKNDVYVLRECLRVMFKEGHDRLTIGSCCLSEFKAKYGDAFYKNDFPNLTTQKLNREEYGADNLDEYIRKAYFGGWCYLVKEKANRVYKHGVTADVNSLYPSMMHSESGNYYPVGYGIMWKGDYIPERCKKRDKYYYYLRFRCKFTLKPGKLPFVKIHGSPYYNARESLTDSMPTVNGKKVGRVRIVDNGQIVDDHVTMTMSCTDYELFNDHYKIEDLEILDGVWFYAEKGMFDDYINKYRKMKEEATVTGNKAKRTISKLFLNNLYGKFSASSDSSYMVPKFSKDGIVQFDAIKEEDKKPGYIAIGAAITSYARNFTIRAAQANYHGALSPGFIYADTDSIHCDLKPEEIKNVPVHPTAFCHWKLESSWDTAIFVRQKTYIEHITHEDLKEVSPYYSVKCAGMPEHCKSMLVERLLNKEAKLTDFRVGYETSGKLMPKRIKGGVILVDTTFKIK